jgi:exonuclease III
MWTGGNRTGIGKAGVALLCKREPGKVWFGVGDEEKDLVGSRVRRYDYRGYLSPKGGFTEETLSEKTKWETQLAGWLKEISSHGKPVVWGGDFNVNPYRDDWTQKAWQHLRGKIGKGIQRVAERWTYRITEKR